MRTDFVNTWKWHDRPRWLNMNVSLRVFGVAILELVIERTWAMLTLFNFQWRVFFGGTVIDLVSGNMQEDVPDEESR